MKYIVTGASSGLGFELCINLMQRGDVIGLSRSPGKAKQLIEDSRFSYIRCDLQNSQDFEKDSTFYRNLVEKIDSQEFALILNAASFYSANQRLCSSSLDDIFCINVLSPIKLINMLSDLCLRRVLFINSVSGLIGQYCQHEYSSTKHALMGFSKSLSKSAKNSLFDVMTINPGGMKTELWDNYPNVNTNDFLEPALIADLCVSLITLPGRVFIENFVILPPSDI